jgi:hypothetical protein
MLQKVIFPEGFRIFSKVNGSYDTFAPELPWLDHGRGKIKTVVRQRFDFLVKSSIPAGTNIHVVIQKYDIVRVNQRAHGIHGPAHTDVGPAVCIGESVLLNPCKGTIRTFIYVDDDLVCEG